MCHMFYRKYVMLHTHDLCILDMSFICLINPITQRLCHLYCMVSSHFYRHIDCIIILVFHIISQSMTLPFPMMKKNRVKSIASSLVNLKDLKKHLLKSVSVEESLMSMHPVIATTTTTITATIIAIHKIPSKLDHKHLPNKIETSLQTCKVYHSILHI